MSDNDSFRWSSLEINSKIKLINKTFPDVVQYIKKDLIEKFLYKIRHIPLFWAMDNDTLIDVYDAIDEIRDYYQKVVKE